MTVFVIAEYHRLMPWAQLKNDPNSRESRNAKLARIGAAGYEIKSNIANDKSYAIWWVDIEDDAEAALFKLTYL